MKTTPQSVRCRGSRIGCNPLSNQQKQTKVERALNGLQDHRQQTTRPGQLASGQWSVVSGQCSVVFAYFAIFCFILAGLSLICASSFAQTPDSVAEREVQRRQAGITQGDAALARG